LLHSVAVDDHAGARLAVDYLLQLGHHSIGYLGTESRPHSNARRQEAYHEALAAAGVRPLSAWIALGAANEARQEDDVAPGLELLPRLLSAGVTAGVCFKHPVRPGRARARRPWQVGVAGARGRV